MAFRFDNFSAQSFEHLIQALCAHKLGPGTVVFGSGPDGGRDAVISGKVPFPSAAEQWDGYTIVQAKCRETPTNDSRDATWLATQPKAELQKLVAASISQKPQYYLLATNVRLSAEPHRGGKAKIDAVFRRYQQRLGLVAWRIW